MQLSHRSGLTLPITSEFHRIANIFVMQCPMPEKAAQIRRNTLAVCAVNSYLQLMEIPTQVEAGDSWQPMMQAMANVADLQVPGMGTLSCRAVLPDEETCYVPEEDWGDRAGYVAVVLNEETSQAILVGFAETVGEQTQVALSQFAPIEALIDKVHSLQTVTASAPAQNSMTRLSQWIEGQIDGLVEAGWQAVDQLLNPAEGRLVFRMPTDVSRAKRVNLGIQFGETVRVALVMELTQVAASEAGIEPQMRIFLRVHPLEESAYLPEGLLLSALDDEAVVVSSVTSRAIDNYVQLEISGEAGEQFGVRLALGESSFEEQFVI